MGHLQDMNKEQRSEFLWHKHNANKEARRGNSFVYWNEKLDKELELKGYDWYRFDNPSYGEYYATSNKLKAEEIVEQLRGLGHYARIICGYSQNVQKIKMFSITYKLKNAPR